ncbi:MAG: YraN family protein [Saprospiraceae bacterium]
MSRNKEIGDYGEKLAVQHLMNSGYEILEKNWRYSRAEIDVICKKSEHLVFVEVKTRSSNRYGEPSDFVSARKEQFMIDAASAYMYEKKYEWKFRFDIISVLLHKDGSFKLQHFEDAFFPGW